jgi:hypothetical protein
MCGAAKILSKDIDIEHARQIVHQALPIAQAMGDSEMRIFVLTRVLETFVRVGDADQALSMAYELPDSLHDFALTAISTAASEVEDFSSAMAAADGVKDLGQRILALVTTVEAVAEAEDSTPTAMLAERVLLAAEGLGDVPRKVWALETVTCTLFRTGNWAQARRSMSATLMAASDTNRSTFLRTLGDLLGSSGEAFKGNGGILWDIGEAICEIDDWWFTT